MRGMFFNDVAGINHSSFIQYSHYIFFLPSKGLSDSFRLIFTTSSSDKNRIFMNYFCNYGRKGFQCLSSYKGFCLIMFLMDLFSLFAVFFISRNLLRRMKNKSTIEIKRIFQLLTPRSHKNVSQQFYLLSFSGFFYSFLSDYLNVELENFKIQSESFFSHSRSLIHVLCDTQLLAL